MKKMAILSRASGATTAVLAALLAVAPAPAAGRPRVHMLSTGGTMAGGPAGPLSGRGLRRESSGHRDVRSWMVLVAALPRTIDSATPQGYYDRLTGR